MILEGRVSKRLQPINSLMILVRSKDHADVHCPSIQPWCPNPGTFRRNLVRKRQSPQYCLLHVPSALSGSIDELLRVCLICGQASPEIRRLGKSEHELAHQQNESWWRVCAVQYLNYSKLHRALAQDLPPSRLGFFMLLAKNKVLRTLQNTLPDRVSLSLEQAGEAGFQLSRVNSMWWKMMNTAFTNPCHATEWLLLSKAAQWFGGTLRSPRKCKWFFYSHRFWRIDEFMSVSCKSFQKQLWPSCVLRTMQDFQTSPHRNESNSAGGQPHSWFTKG